MGSIIKASTQITTLLVLKKLAEGNTFMFLTVKSNKLKKGSKSEPNLFLQ